MSISTLMDWSSEKTTTVNRASPANLNYIVYRGDTWVDNLVFTNITDANNPTPIDISSFVFKIDLKKNTFDKDPAISLSLGNGLSITGDDNNVLSIFYTITIKSGTYVYDIEATKTNGQIETYAKGLIKILEDV